MNDRIKIKIVFSKRESPIFLGNIYGSSNKKIVEVLSFSSIAANSFSLERVA